MHKFSDSNYILAHSPSVVSLARCHSGYATTFWLRACLTDTNIETNDEDLPRLRRKDCNSKSHRVISAHVIRIRPSSSLKQLIRKAIDLHDRKLDFRLLQQSTMPIKRIRDSFPHVFVSGRGRIINDVDSLSKLRRVPGILSVVRTATAAETTHQCRVSWILNLSRANALSPSMPNLWPAVYILA